jgi:rRNA maturation endonuclease Nob1
MKRVVLFQFKCLNCFWSDKVDIEWTSPEHEDKCPICGKMTMSKKMISLEVKDE